MRAAQRGRWLATAAALGISADAFLRATPWGLNGVVWAGSVVAAGILWRRRGVSLHRGPSPWLLGGALLLVGMAAWRADPLLVLADYVGAVVLLAVAARRARTAALPVEGRRTSLGAALLDVPGNFFLAVRAAKGWALARRSDGVRSRWRAVLTGAGLSVPALFLFGGLFASADPVFDHMVRSAIRVEWPSVFGHAVWIGWFGWAAGAYLLGVTRAPVRGRPARHLVSLGGVEVLVVLGSVAAVFALFLVTQAGALFGGEGFVQRTSGLTFAAYARRGFYQLTAAAALSLPLVVGAGAVLRKDRPADRRQYSVIAAIQLGLLVLVLGSALWRMALYVQAYGMSLDRLYAIAFIAWLGGMTALAGWGLRRGGAGGAILAHGGLLGAFLSIVLLHAVNPAALVLRWNLDRAAAGRSFDAAYAASLGADAVPALVAAVPILSQADRCLVVERLRRSRSYWDGGWRTYNVGRARAEAARGGVGANDWYATCSPEAGMKGVTVGEASR